MAGLVPYRNTLGSIGFDNFFEDFFKNPLSMTQTMANTFRLDVREDNDNYYVEADLPGIPKENISVTLKDKKLLIEVNQEEKKEEEGPSYLHRERHTYSAARSIYLSEAKGNDIGAKLENGVLQISVPKIQIVDTTYNVEIQ